MKLLNLLIILTFLVSCKSKVALVTKESAEERSYFFPVDWIGIYEGTLNIFSPKGDTTEVNMSLTIDYPDALGVYPWVLKYGDKDIRSYGLEAVNAEIGHYLIDEYNSIKLDAYLRGNTFTSAFQVEDNYLLFEYYKTKAGIQIKVIIHDYTKANITGGETIAEQKVPMVKSFPLLGYQEAFLKKIK